MGEDEGAQQSHSIMDGSDGSASNECFKHHPDERTMSPGAPEFSKPDPDDEVETNPLLDDDLDPNKADEDDDDALAAGPPIDIFSMAYIGYLPQYFAVGVINQGLPSMIYGVFLGYLNVPSHIYITGLTVVSMPWTFKFFFGMLSDCVPILKLRRKPYICIGWTICCGMMLALAFTPLPDPYYCRDTEGKYITHSAENVPAKACNEDAASSGGKFAVMMMFAIFGMVIADVAADGMTVEIARREPRSSRGYTQTSAYLTRSIGQACAVALIAFCMNGYEYSGTFSWTLSFNQICGILAVPPALMVPLSWFGINEEQVPDEHRDTFEQYGTKVWELLTGRAMFSVLVYQFCTPVVSSISTTAGGHVKMEWAGVKNLQNQLFTLFGLLLFAWGLWLVRKHFLHSSWRGMMLITSAVLIAIDAPFVFLTIFDVVRNQYFYLGETVLIEIPAAANFVVSTFVIVEMAADGTEGIVYGMLTTVRKPPPEVQVLISFCSLSPFF
eukprot:TRINITY_DN1970_c0_g1_i9.p1 TRINITY_DN1970_c0_g1~~TRINITY_DN1970_c0_g1_i9.p1  ORF type:complete len:498 (-),score=127.06 TRINITY_DN1970_c0_g1_i9:24-1517(-)